MKLKLMTLAVRSTLSEQVMNRDGTVFCPEHPCDRLMREHMNSVYLHNMMVFLRDGEATRLKLYGGRMQGKSMLAKAMLEEAKKNGFKITPNRPVRNGTTIHKLYLEEADK